MKTKRKRKTRQLQLIERPYVTLDGDRALGVYWGKKRMIEIDGTQRPQEFAETLVHECLHHFFPEASENLVEKASVKIVKFLWEKNYRRLVPD
jgi:hypothetical protein